MNDDMKTTIDTLAMIVGTAANATYRVKGAKLVDELKAELIRLYAVEEQLKTDGEEWKREFEGSN